MAISSPLGRRLLRGFGATALNPLVTAVTQLGPVPLLLHAWGAAKYGDWLLLSAFPTYLTLSNLGLGDASGSDMTVRVAAGDKEGALRTFQSSFALVAAVAAAIILLASMSVWSIPWQRWLHLSSVSSHQAAAIVLVFGAYVLAWQQGGVLESGFRCDGNFAVAIFWLSMLRLAENLLASLVGILTGNLLWMATTYLVTRTAGTLAFGLLLRRKSPWLHLGVRHVSLKALKDLAAPALGFTALPLGYGISLQGFTILIGTSLGPLFVTSFSTLRTLTRLNSQILNVVGWSVWPEFSAAFGAGNIPLARRLHRHAFQVGVAVSALVVLLLWNLGPHIYRLWVRKAVNFDASCFHILLLVALADSLWFVSSVVPMSTNAHQRLSLTFVGGSSASLIAAYFLIPILRLDGAAWALLLASLSMMGMVLRATLRQLHDTPGGFVAALLKFPGWWRPARTGAEA
jgi:O-antigen/teichoic acid export membrane protein